MANDQKDLNAKVEEYHLMVEEVLGGMDIMMTQMDERINHLEKAIEILQLDKLDNHNNSLREDIKQLKREMTEGLNLAFRKINGQ